MLNWPYFLLIAYVILQLGVLYPIATLIHPSLPFVVCIMFSLFVNCLDYSIDCEFYTVRYHVSDTTVDQLLEPLYICLSENRR